MRDRKHERSIPIKNKQANKIKKFGRKYVKKKVPLNLCIMIELNLYLVLLHPKKERTFSQNQSFFIFVFVFFYTSVNRPPKNIHNGN